MVGLGSDNSTGVLSDIAMQMQEGLIVLEPGLLSKAIFKDFECLFQPMNDIYKNSFTIEVGQYYRDESYKAFQVVWPDQSGKWPHDKNFNPTMKALQPVLYTIN